GPTNPKATSRTEQLRAFLLYLKKKDLSEINLAPHLRLRKGGAKIAGTAGQDFAIVDVTREGIEALRGELDTLVSQRSGVREEIRKAMLDKDFRENAPLDASKDKQGHIEARIREIEATLKRAVVVQQSAEGDRVQVGVTVRVRHLRSGAINRVTIVGPTASNAAAGTCRARGRGSRAARSDMAAPAPRGEAMRSAPRRRAAAHASRPRRRSSRCSRGAGLQRCLGRPPDCLATARPSCAVGH